MLANLQKMRELLYIITRIIENTLQPNEKSGML